MWLWLVIAILVALWGYAFVRTTQARRLMNSDWAIRTSLPDDQLDVIIMKTMKGLNPLTDIARPEPGLYVREMSRGMGSNRNVAIMTAQVSRTEDGSREFLVHCEIPEWHGRAALGVRETRTVFKCQRRIDAIMRAIRAADPSATVLADPKQAALSATTGV